MSLLTLLKATSGGGGVTLAVDASTPVLTAGLHDPWVTASFTPPNNSLLVVGCMGDFFGGTPTLTPTSSGLTFTSQKKQGTINQGVAEIFTAEVGSNGGTARTVSVTTSLASDPGAVKVWVVTGYDASTSSAHVDATGGGTSTTNNLTVAALTTVTDDALVLAVGTEWENLGAPTSTDSFENSPQPGGGVSVISVRKAGLVSPAASVNLNFDAAGTSTARWTWAAIAIKPDTGGGGTTFPVAQTDSAGLVDSAVLDQTKVVTDSAGLTDVRAITVSPVLTDLTGLTDTSLVELSKLVAQTDSAGLTDAAALDQSKTVTDSAGLTDTTALAQSKVLSDSSGLTDTSLVESGKAIGQTDSVGLTDTQAFDQAHVLTDSIGLSDSTGLVVSKSLTDLAGLTDAASVGILRAVAATDSAGLTDAAILFQTAVLTDLVGLADSTAFSQLHILTDSAGMTDAAEASNFFPITFRPNTGSTARPSSGTTVRPNSGITARP